MISRSHSAVLYATLLILLGSCEAAKPKLFKTLSSDHTGLTHSNSLIENERYNVINFTNFYTGSGIAVADFDRDGQLDLFLGGNMSPSSLYKNLGALQFQDITKSAGIETDRWITGAVAHDINGDGWIDLYLSVSGFEDENYSRSNLLYINQGLKDDLPVFKESSKEYGLDIAAQVTQSVFFDYDRDGDDDIFMIVNPTDYDLGAVNNIRKPKRDGEALSTDILMENLGNGTYSNVSAESGILIEGYSLGVALCDVNQDGWLDIYVCNDFVSNDILYVNQQDGTFADELDTRMWQSSFASMGIDIQDVNLDGHGDIMTLDMLPEDHERYHSIVTGVTEDRHRYMLSAGFSPQYSRNQLQLSDGNGNFHEVGQYAGVAKTDWSWSTLIQDFDGDGVLDIHVTNGFGRDMGHLDYINFANKIQFGDAETIRKQQIESIVDLQPASLQDYFFRGTEDLSFDNMSEEWAGNDPTVSNAAAYADFDNDGDLDLVVQRLFELPAFLENQTSSESRHFVRIVLEDSLQRSVIGSKLSLITDQNERVQIYSPVRGYLSSVDPRIHFGLAPDESIKALKIQWPDGKMSTIDSIAVNTTTIVDRSKFKKSTPETSSKSVLSTTALAHRSMPDDYSDFKHQVLLLKGESKEGPHFQVHDVNHDDKPDLILGSDHGEQSVLVLSYLEPDARRLPFPSSSDQETACIQAYDLDGDGEEEYILGSGGFANISGDDYQDLIYSYEEGELVMRSDLMSFLPRLPTSQILPLDDHVADAGGLLFLHRNEPDDFTTTVKHHVSFDRPQNELSNQLLDLLHDLNYRHIKHASWADLDDNGLSDLVVLADWQPISILYQYSDGFKTELVEGTRAWWRSMDMADVDSDGDLDLILGNWGKNHSYWRSNGEGIQLGLYALSKDLSIPIFSYREDGIQFPTATRDMLLTQIPKLKRKYADYASYARSSISEIFESDSAYSSTELGIDIFASIVMINQEDSWSFRELPAEFQMSSVNDCILEDFDQDGNVDIVCGVNTEDMSAFNGPCIYKSLLAARGAKSGCFQIVDLPEIPELFGKCVNSLESINIDEDMTSVLLGIHGDSLRTLSFSFASLDQL